MFLLAATETRDAQWPSRPSRDGGSRHCPWVVTTCDHGQDAAKQLSCQLEDERRGFHLVVTGSVYAHDAGREDQRPGKSGDDRLRILNGKSRSKSSSLQRAPARPTSGRAVCRSNLHPQRRATRSECATQQRTGRRTPLLTKNFDDNPGLSTDTVLGIEAEALTACGVELSTRFILSNRCPPTAQVDDHSMPQCVLKPVLNS